MISTIRGKNGYIQDEHGSYMEFVADQATDIANIPTGSDTAKSEDQPRPGSMASCIENGNLYILSNARVWEIFAEGQK